MMQRQTNLRAKLLSLTLAAALLVTMLPTSVLAASSASGNAVTLLVNNTTADDSAARAEGATYKTLQGAIGKAENGDTIVLNTDTQESSVLIGSQNLTIDFNGHRLTCSSTSYGLDVYGTSAINLKDSSTDGSGGITQNSTVTSCILAEDIATVTIESGSYASQFGNCVESASGSTGQITINGGSYTSSSACVNNNGSKAKIFLNSGTFSGNIVGSGGGILLTPEMLEKLYSPDHNILFNNIYIRFPSGANQLQKDLDLHDWQLRVIEGDETTIDLNGYTITGNGMQNAPLIGGGVVSGNIENLSCLIQVHQTGKLTIKNTGACDPSHGRIHNDATPLIYLIKNYGDLTLDGNIKIDANIGYAKDRTRNSAVYMYSAFKATDDAAALTINDGVEMTAKKAASFANKTYYTCGIVVESAAAAGTSVDKTQITINGGAIYGDYYAMSLCGTLTINGGTFKNSDASAGEVFYIGYPVANLTGISNASFIGKNEAMWVGSQAFQSDTITLNNITINKTAGFPIANGIAQEGETKNVIVTGKDTYWVAAALTLTSDYCKGVIKIKSGIFSADPTTFVIDANNDGKKDYAVLDYHDSEVSNYFLVSPWTEVGTDNTVSLYYAADAADDATAADRVDIAAIDDIEEIVSDSTRVKLEHFTLSSSPDTYTAIPGLSVTAFDNATGRLTVQKTKSTVVADNKAYVWYGGKSVGEIVFESINEPTHEVNGDITGDADATPTAKLVRDGVYTSVAVSGSGPNWRYHANVPAGEYNLIVSAMVNGKPVTVTVLVTVAQAIRQNVTLPSGTYNSVVTFDGSDTLSPNLEAGGLDDIAAKAGESAANTNVLIELRGLRNETTPNAADVKARIKQDRGMVKGVMMDFDLFESINNSPAQKIVDLSAADYGVNLITVIFHLPEAIQGKDGYAIYRYHGAQVDKITETTNTNGEHITVDTKKTTVTAHLNKFSSYAIAYYEPSATNTITATAGANGSISPSGAVAVNDGDNQSFAITANNGYEVGDVLVDGASVGAVSGYLFSNVTTDHVISVSFKATPMPPKPGNPPKTGDSSMPWLWLALTIASFLIGGAIAFLGKKRKVFKSLNK